mmetsp:Transcript_1109/g.3978  ORF Transcript_1109/g.3978 Transcript_1109/m.3978 type:complete len:300 (+) Transcript_1109:81-980(+)
MLGEGSGEVREDGQCLREVHDVRRREREPERPREEVEDIGEAEEGPSDEHDDDNAQAHGHAEPAHCAAGDERCHVGRGESVAQENGPGGVLAGPLAEEEEHNCACARTPHSPEVGVGRAHAEPEADRRNEARSREHDAELLQGHGPARVRNPQLLSGPDEGHDSAEEPHGGAEEIDYLRIVERTEGQHQSSGGGEEGAEQRKDAQPAVVGRRRRLARKEHPLHARRLHQTRHEEGPCRYAVHQEHPVRLAAKVQICRHNNVLEVVCRVRHSLHEASVAEAEDHVVCSAVDDLVEREEHE